MEQKLRLTRQDFLRVSAVTGAGALLAACGKTPKIPPISSVGGEEVSQETKKTAAAIQAETEKEYSQIYVFPTRFDGYGSLQSIAVTPTNYFDVKGFDLLQTAEGVVFGFAVPAISAATALGLIINPGIVQDIVEPITINGRPLTPPQAALLRLGRPVLLADGNVIDSQGNVLLKISYGPKFIDETLIPEVKRFVFPTGEPNDPCNRLPSEVKQLTEEGKVPIQYHGQSQTKIMLKIAKYFNQKGFTGKIPSIFGRDSSVTNYVKGLDRSTTIEILKAVGFAEKDILSLVSLDVMHSQLTLFLSFARQMVEEEKRDEICHKWDVTGLNPDEITEIQNLLNSIRAGWR